MINLGTFCRWCGQSFFNEGKPLRVYTDAKGNQFDSVYCRAIYGRAPVQYEMPLERDDFYQEDDE